MTSLIRLSQSHLNLLDNSPEQFKQIYLQQLQSPVSPEQLERSSWGNQFHLLMQQRELGLPIESLLQGEEQLDSSLTALVEAAPDILDLNQPVWRAAEHHLSLQFQNYLLTAIYDLLVLDEHQALILDWKTYLQPENGGKVEQNWQTRLYLYLLAETSDYLPEQLSMTYWFVKLPQQPQHLTFSYNSDRHQQTHQDLNRLVKKLEQWLEEDGVQDSLSEGESENLSNWQISLADIPEVPL